MIEMHSQGLRPPYELSFLHSTVTVLILIDISLHKKFCKFRISSKVGLYTQFPEVLVSDFCSQHHQ